MLAKTIVASTLAALSFSAAALDYFVVVPVKGRTATTAQPVISVTLNTYSLPGAQEGVPYTFNLKPLLSVTGDGAYTGAGVTWSVVSSTLPAGLALTADGFISGTPTASGTGAITVRATYKDKNGEQTYTVNSAGVGIVLNGATRTWANGTVAASCQAYRNPASGYSYSGDTGDGTYRIQPAGQSAMDAYCDMTTAGGGWMLVLNYLHKGGTNPALSLLTNRLPLRAGTVLGSDESASATSWGHAVPSLLSKLNFGEMRFSCATSNHARVMDFTTNTQSALDYFRTGTGSMQGFTATTLSGHNAALPGAVTNYFTDRGDLALTSFPFWRNATYHWGIKGGANVNRWECDDFPDGASQSTRHSVWVR